MMKLVIFFAIVLSAAVGVLAQAPTASPASQPAPRSTPPPSPNNNIPGPQRIRDADLRMLQQFPLTPPSESGRSSVRVAQLQSIAPLYRKPGGKQLASVEPSGTILQTYSDFLRQDDTGIFRLVADSGCVYTDRVINVREDCLKYRFPGAGNSFSFRTEGYRLRHLADLTFAEGKLRMTGIFMHSIAVELGDVAIESASLTTPGMSYLTEFQPSTSSDEVVKVDDALARGIRIGTFVYSKDVAPVVDRTYALRAVAYRGRVARSIGGVRYNELDYDKRRDVIVVFRVVQMGDDGVTIVWRKLADKEPPRIKMPKVDLEVDDGEAN